MSASALSPSAVDQPLRCRELKSEEGSALSAGDEAITVDPAVGPQLLCFCRGDTVCVRVKMWEVDLSEALRGFSLPSTSFHISDNKERRTYINACFFLFFSDYV